MEVDTNLFRGGISSNWGTLTDPVRQMLPVGEKILLRLEGTGQCIWVSPSDGSCTETDSYSRRVYPSSQFSIAGVHPHDETVLSLFGHLPPFSLPKLLKAEAATVFGNGLAVFGGKELHLFVNERKIKNPIHTWNQAPSLHSIRLTKSRLFVHAGSTLLTWKLSAKKPTTFEDVHSFAVGKDSAAILSSLGDLTVYDPDLKKTTSKQGDFLALHQLGKDEWMAFSAGSTIVGGIEHLPPVKESIKQCCRSGPHIVLLTEEGKVLIWDDKEWQVCHGKVKHIASHGETIVVAISEMLHSWDVRQALDKAEPYAPATTGPFRPHTVEFVWKMEAYSSSEVFLGPTSFAVWSQELLTLYVTANGDAIYQARISSPPSEDPDGLLLYGGKGPYHLSWKGEESEVKLPPLRSEVCQWNKVGGILVTRTSDGVVTSSRDDQVIWQFSETLGYAIQEKSAILLKPTYVSKQSLHNKQQASLPIEATDGFPSGLLQTPNDQNVIGVWKNEKLIFLRPDGKGNDEYEAPTLVTAIDQSNGILVGATAGGVYLWRVGEPEVQQSLTIETPSSATQLSFANGHLVLRGEKWIRTYKMEAPPEPPARTRSVTTTGRKAPLQRKKSSLQDFFKRKGSKDG